MFPAFLPRPRQRSKVILPYTQVGGNEIFGLKFAYCFYSEVLDSPVLFDSASVGLEDTNPKFSSCRHCDIASCSNPASNNVSETFNLLNISDSRNDVDKAIANSKFESIGP